MADIDRAVHKSAKNLIRIINSSLSFLAFCQGKYSFLSISSAVFPISQPWRQLRLTSSRASGQAGLAPSAANWSRLPGDAAAAALEDGVQPL